MKFTSACFILFLICFSADAEARSKGERLAERAAKVVSATLARPPEPNEVCFSPDGPCEAKLVKFIQSAKKSIDLAVFDLNLDSVVHELISARSRLRVRVLVDRRASKNGHSGVGALRQAGVPVRFGRQKGLMHHKFLIVDEKRLQLGSFNYTNGAANKNQENQLYLEHAEIVGRYLARFERMWSDSTQ